MGYIAGYAVELLILAGICVAQWHLFRTAFAHAAGLPPVLRIGVRTLLLAAGGVIVLDNANWYIDWPTRTPGSRYRRGPANEHWREFQRMVEGWRFTWTSDGVSDAAIWVKPG